MKILDEKGNLFGKINIVDFSITFLFLIIIPAFFYMYEVLDKRPTMVPHKWIKAEAVTFTIPEMAELMKPGDISYDEQGNPDGKVLKILKKDKSYSDQIKNAMIDINNTTYGYKVPVFLELELSCTKSAINEPWYYRRFPLTPSLDRGFAFGTNRYDTYCVMIKIKE